MTAKVEAGAAPWSASSRILREAGTSPARVRSTLTFTRSERAIATLTLVDVVEPQAPAGFAGKTVATTADLSAPGAAAKAIAARPDVIFHLAAIVSGEAEADFDKGYRINLDGTRLLFEAVREEGLKSPYRPRR